MKRCNIYARKMIYIYKTVVKLMIANGGLKQVIAFVNPFSMNLKDAMVWSTHYSQRPISGCQISGKCRYTDIFEFGYRIFLWPSCFVQISISVYCSPDIE
jgi:hypothetical protein